MAMARGGGGPLSEINVTPLVDVMLVLLIIFMVTAPLLQTGIQVDLPPAHARVMEMPEGKVLLVIDKQQKVYLEDREVPLGSLETVLGSNERLRQEHEIYLQADETIPYGFAVKVMAMASSAGIENLNIVTDPLRE
jgi:biopolymer transport protein TolR